VHPVSSGDSPHPGLTLAALIYDDEPGEDGAAVRARSRIARDMCGTILDDVESRHFKVQLEAAARESRMLMKTIRAFA
jgi:hypothetical protein